MSATASVNDSSACSQPGDQIPFKPLDSGLRLKGTPVDILHHINDLETPSPNSRQITPMPKTTLFISPLAVKGDASQFPATKYGPLLPITPMAENIPLSLTPATRLSGLTLHGTPLNVINKRRDSVFFAPSNENFDSSKENLICFSSVSELGKLTVLC